MSRQLAILIADDSEVFRTGLTHIILNTPYCVDVKDTDCNGGFSNLMDTFHPDILFLDIERNGDDYFLFLSTVIKRFSATKMIAIYEKNEEKFIQQLYAQNTNGIIHRNAPASEYLTALSQVIRDDVFYCQNTLKLLSSQTIYAKRKAAGTPGDLSFTTREKQIITLICKELTAKEIADKLTLSKRTVENIKMKLQEKMHAKNIAGIVSYAYRYNLVGSVV